VGNRSEKKIWEGGARGVSHWRGGGGKRKGGENSGLEIKKKNKERDDWRRKKIPFRGGY